LIAPPRGASSPASTIRHSMKIVPLSGSGRDSPVLEIGCGLGRLAYPLRWMLTDRGRYEGFDVVKLNIDFLQGGFQRHMPNLRFTWANLYNTYYNPEGRGAANHAARQRILYSSRAAERRP
jgi:hypothetical protein